MTLVIVHAMELSPYTCLLCSTNPVDDDGNPKKSIFAEGVDVDWGNSVYICEECGDLIVDLMGRSTKEGFDRVTAQRDDLREKYNALLTDYEEQQELVDKIREGSEAIKKVKATR